MGKFKSAFFTIWLAALLVAPPLASAAPSTDQTIGTASRRLERNPSDRTALIMLGGAYARKGRETGDSRYFVLASEALQRCVDTYPQYGAARRHLAYVLSLQHDFVGSIREAQAAIALDPADADAHGILGDGHIELGQYDNAEKAYGHMIGLEESLATLSRRSGLYSLMGNPKGAVADLRRAIDLGRRANEAPESIAWAQWQLGMEHLNVGQVKDAESAFRDALVSFPEYYRAHAGLALVHIARGQFGRAVQAYEKAVASVPLPEYAIALGHLHTRLGHKEEAASQYALVEQLAQLSADPYNRENILFRLDHGDKSQVAQALELAQKSLDVRKGIYAYDTLAWALYKNDRLADARDAMERALKLGTIDPKLFYHAGMIYRAAGEKAKGVRYLRRALAINANFHVLHAQAARKALRTATTVLSSSAPPAKI